MGYRGKPEERARARELRAAGWTMPDIAVELGVSRSSVSAWIRDVAFDTTARRSPRTGRRPRGSEHPMRRRKLAEIERLRIEGVGRLSEREFLVAGLGLHTGDGAKGDHSVKFSNSDPQVVAFYCRWLRRFFAIDEARLRVQIYLHDGLDLDAANRHWSEVTGIPVSQFTRPCRAVPDAMIRHNKHVHGCAHVTYSCTRTQRTIMAMMRALLVAPTDSPG